MTETIAGRSVEVFSRPTPVKNVKRKQIPRFFVALSVLFSILPFGSGAWAQETKRTFLSGYAGTLPTDTNLLARNYFDDPKVRLLIYWMEHGPISRDRVTATLSGSPFTIDDLLRVKLLREENNQYFIGFNYFTAKDQEAIVAYVFLKRDTDYDDSRVAMVMKLSLMSPHNVLVISRGGLRAHSADDPDRQRAMHLTGDD